jgi:hypothetical protein
MTFEEETLSILRPSEWRDDPVQAAEDLYDIMGDAEKDASRKSFLLRNIRNGATEVALKTYSQIVMGIDNRMSNEDNRRILAKIRNWFAAAIKANDTDLLSLILEVTSLPTVADFRLLKG